MIWELKFLPEAIDDLNKLEYSTKVQILKGIHKVLQNPEAKYLGGYGTPLGNKNNLNLSGLYKIKFKSLGQRVVYALKKTKNEMIVVVILARDDMKVYKEALKRRKDNKL